MNANEIRQKFAEAVAAIKAEYESLTPAQKRAPVGRSSRIRRIRAERCCYIMQRKVHLFRLGLDVEAARQLARDGLIYLHMDRHRHPESAVLREAN